MLRTTFQLDKLTSNGCNSFSIYEENLYWNVLRRSYKALIHKWHPDRLSDNSLKKEIAYEKIKDINVAYSQLYRFYRKNNILPPIEIADKLKTRRADQTAPSSTQQETVYAKTEKDSSESSTSPSKARTRHNTGVKSSFRALIHLSLIIVFAFISLYFIHTQTIDQRAGACRYGVSTTQYIIG